jgi:amino acid adenylation domain-containing protein/non-ribosomal peptide synthase protein (TIGR01720 family)
LKQSQEDAEEHPKPMKNVEDVYVASPLQQGLIFHGLYEPESSAYSVQMICDLEGKLDVELFRRAWLRVFERYAILRTFFIWEEGKQVLQVVRAKVRLPWQEFDWQALSPAEQDSQLQSLVEKDRTQGFDFSQAPLVRISLIRLSDREAKFVWCHHHSLLDGWSAFRVFNEAFKFYEAFVSGGDLTLPPARPYRDYIVWLQQQDLSAAERFWRERLNGFTNASPLTRDRREQREREPLSEAIEQQEHRERLYLSGQTTSSLKLLAREHQLTLNTVMQGAWALLLSRYSGETDVLFGTVVSGRPPELSGVEEMVGPFINLLPLRVRVDDELELLPWLKQLQSEQVEMRGYEYSPLVEVQGWSDVPRGLPLFETMMVFENYPITSSTQKPEVSLKMTRVKNVEKTSYPLTFEVVPAGKLVLQLSYDTGYFTKERVDRMLQHLGRILEEMVAHPGARLREFSLLTPTERHQMLIRWNDTHRDYSPAIALQHLFEAQVQRTPDHVAICYEGEQLSYLELNYKSNQLAHYLRALGVGPETLVGILVERSVEMVVGLLAILKAGGAYLPLDPTYPSERLNLMIKDAEIDLLLTQQQFVTQMSQQVAQVVCLNTDWQKIARESRENVSSEVTADNLAYVIYTSGSTGQPKGAMNTHRGICNRLQWMQEEYQLTPDDRVLQKTPFSFDVSVWEFFWPLITGARLVVARPGGHQDASYLLKLIKEQQITTLHFVPSMLRVFLEEDGVETCTDLRRVICSGEALSPALEKRFHSRLRAGLHNLYGPTEAAVDVTYWACERNGERNIVPIGRPIANTEIYIIDKNLAPAPIGLNGELHIGGVGLARGYLKRAELTAENFLPHPFSQKPGARLYRTGDLARFLPKGEIEFLGRADDQLKIRGFRIEAGEVETTLTSHPHIREAVVIARVNESGDKQLIAYLVTEIERTPTSSELREYLGKKLPEYMIPSAYVMLKELPLTANGKVDRRALPAPDTRQGQSEKNYVGARTEAEQTLVEIWEAVLGVERVGIYDNFFELGGDSILSIQIVARTNRAGLHLTPKDLFQHQEIAGLAQVISEAGEVVAAEQGAVSGAVRLTPIQEWFFESELEEAGHYNQSVLLKVKAEIEEEKLAAALQGLMKQHDALRQRFKRGAAGWEGWNEATEELQLERVDLRGKRGAERGAAIAARAATVQGSLNLSEGPLLRAVYFDCGEEEAGRLLLVVHHLVVDGVSWRILLEDLQRGYEQLSSGGEVELGAKSTSFQRWAEELTVQAQEAELQGEVGYWVAQGWERARELPVEKESGRQRIATAGTVSKSLSEEETRKLLQEVPETYHTQINEVLMTALGRALGGWLGEGEVVIEVEGHGREEVVAGLDLSRTVGWFTTIYPVLLAVGEEEELGAGLKRVKEQLRQIPQHGIGFGMLKYLSADEAVREQMRKVPGGAVSFNYLGQFDQVLRNEAVIAVADESSGPVQSSSNQLEYQLWINSIVRKGKLEVTWGYSKHSYENATIDQLAESYMEGLREIIAHCESAEAGGFTPSDFPEANLSQSDLDRFISRISQAVRE